MSDVMTPQQATTLAQLIRGAALAYGDAPAIALRHDDGDTETLSFVELEQRSAQLAKGLLTRGVGKGTRIGFIAGNGPEFAVQFAAIGRIGAIAVPISTLSKSNDLIRLLRQCDIAGLIVQRSLLGKDLVGRLCEALPQLVSGTAADLFLPQLPYLRWIVSSGDALPATVRDISWLTDTAAVDDALLAQVESEVHSTDQLLEIYTSGSMALPKGVKHNHGPTLFRTHYLRSKLPLQTGMQVTLPLPLFWVGGLMMFLLPNWENGVTTLCTQSTSTNSKIAMGSVLADEDLVEYPPGVTIWALGMTETLGPYSFADTLRVPGYPLCPPLDHIADGYEVRVANERDEPINDGSTGEIQVRGYALTPGLHKIEREKYFTADGYYRTGDLGEWDGSRILFVGRNGDLIKTNNTNVSPAEVEQEIQQLPGVHSAYVVGIPDPEKGQLVAAAIVPRENQTVDFLSIEQTLKQRLSSFKVPKAYIAISREQVPMLPSNKVARRQIEQMLAEQLGS